MTQSPPVHWPVPQMIIFRFVFILLLLFIFFFNNGAYPLMWLLMKYPQELLHIFIPWLGKNLLDVPYEITTFMNGSGDTTYHYVVLFFITMLSGAGTILWTLTDRKADNYNVLFYWLTVAVRFYVGIMLINYGAVKVIKLQFPSPGLLKLTQAYGDSSPMGLAWTFLGFSKGYNLVMGIAELMAGLLLFRRTVTIGAIMTLMASANIMAVNYFYDIPVKIVSTALVFMSLFLLAPNFMTLMKLFFAGEAVKLRTLTAPPIKRRWLISKYSLKYLCIFFVCATLIWSVLSRRTKYGDQAPKSPLYGAYQVDKVSGPENSDPRRWKILMMQGLNHSTIKYIDDAVEYCDVETDTTAKSISFVYNKDTSNPRKFNYTIIDPEHLVLRSTPGDSVVVELTKMKFLLTDRRFHWINERPFNR
jgi:hypothetical protein